MSILGTRGFFEWAIIAEDESVEDLAILAANRPASFTSAGAGGRRMRGGVLSRAEGLCQVWGDTL